MWFSLKIALASLKAHRLRTLLAMVGVLLGALALCAVQHISAAMYAKARQETAKLGTNLFVAQSGKLSFRRSGEARVRNQANNFTLQDARALIAGLPAVRLGAPFVNRSMPIRAGATKIPAQLVGTTSDYLAVRNARVAEGRFLNAADEEALARVCVLGSKIAERLFGRPEAALGQEVFFFRASARVVGVMEAKGADIVGTDQDEQVYIPLGSFLRRFANQNWISGVYLQLANPQDYETTRRAARDILRARHHLAPGEEDDFALLTAEDTMKVQQQALDLVQTLGLISSSVSFAVGGLGILSIMILLVRTRRLEIGVRRAVGANRGDIIRQFMFEAGVMGGLGGSCGVLLAAVLVRLVYHFGKLPVLYDPLYLLGPLFGSVLLGLAAGAYPAWQAAQVEVLETLRKE